jgi:5-formyltetrahydrofolate cyclo-ligase
MASKAVLRQRLLAQRMALTPHDITYKSACITTYVHALPAFCASHTVMIYLALTHEVQTSQIITRAYQLQKRVAVPVVRGAELISVVLHELNTPLRRSSLGILEPCEPYTVIPPADLDCVFVPGVAFDAAGGRLGFGKGYYDRFLGQLPTTTYRCGLAFSIQVIPCVPQDAHDVCMHGIITEQGHYPCTCTPPSVGCAVASRRSE